MSHRPSFEPLTGESIQGKKLQLQSELRVYSRRNAPQSTVSDQHCQEPEPNVGIPLNSPSENSPEVNDSLDVPIALRKGVRSCTQYPISNYVPYKHLSSSFRAFASKLANVEISKNVEEALKVPEWREAVFEGMRAP